MERDSTGFETIHEGWLLMNETLRGVLAQHWIDEMALLFPDAATVYHWLNEAVCREGVALFNTSTDRVTTGPIMSVYDVAFWFLTTPHPYRVEAMVCGPGSPLHTALVGYCDAFSFRPQGLPTLGVHASFKCDTEEDYAVALGALRAAGWELLQRCDAGYGRYSYWHNPDGNTEKAWFLKPRVNLRDMENSHE